MFKRLLSLFKREDTNDPWKKAFKNILYRSKNNITYHREKQDDLIDCIGEEVKDIYIHPWQETIVISFTDGHCLEIERTEDIINKFSWKLEVSEV